MKLPDKLSYSQTSTYIDCGERYRIERMHQMRGGTWFSTIGGSALHEGTEYIDRAAFAGYDYAPKDLDEAGRVFTSLFLKHLRIARERGEELKASGRLLKNYALSGGPNKKDEGWWLHYGPHFLMAWVYYRKSKPNYSIYTMPNGNPGIEVPFDIQVIDENTFEAVELRGYIDRVMLDEETGNVTVLDLKSGNEPSSSLQLATYAMGLQQNYGVTASLGHYWFPRPTSSKDDIEGTCGYESRRVDFSEWSIERLANMYLTAQRGIQNKVFLPHVSSMCKGCGVKDYCWATNGSKYKSLPVVSQFDHEGSDL